MAALDMFEWFVSTQLKKPEMEIQAYIRNQRDYLFSLRSEDERQRTVDETIASLHEMIGSKKKG